MFGGCWCLGWACGADWDVQVETCGQQTEIWNPCLCWVSGFDADGEKSVRTQVWCGEAADAVEGAVDGVAVVGVGEIETVEHVAALGADNVGDEESLELVDVVGEVGVGAEVQMVGVVVVGTW